MKKYVKPVLIYERYELSQDIAACAWDMNFDENACVGLADPDIMGVGWGGPVFDGDRGCFYDYENDFEGFCYHNGSEFKNIFQS